MLSLVRKTTSGGTRVQTFCLWMSTLPTECIDPQEIDLIFCNAIPWWRGVERVYIPSNSSCIHRKSDGALVSRKTGYHIYIVVTTEPGYLRLGMKSLSGLSRPGQASY